jgi:phosphatidylglycerophosphate synthase
MPYERPLQCGMLRVFATMMARHHPHPRFGPANYVTLSRAVMVGLVAALIGRPGTPTLLWFIVGIAALAAVLDGVDGWLARRSGMASAFGARFDMETDAALIMVLSILVWQHEKAGSWVLLSGLLRYIFVAAGWVLPWLAGPLRPTWRGKTIAIAQLVVLICAVAPIIPVTLSSAAAAIALILLGGSFALDVIWLSRQDSA